MHTLSFTGARQVRFPAPDVARGFMLALIALANVPFWLRYFPDAPQVGEAALAAMNDADQWWYLVRTLFVDRRAYPLFSILFGFGMAIMASRTIERERRVAMDAIPPELSAGWTTVQWENVRDSVERRARRAASRLIRRRGWWMLAFGLVHGIVFAGDIIGAYGLVAVIFAEVIVMRRPWLRVLVGAIIASLSMLGIWSMAAMVGREPMVLESHGPVALDASYPLFSLASWLIATPMTVLTALVVPCVMIGVGVARWGLLQDPRGRGPLLVGIALVGLGIGALGALPFALMQLDWAFVGSAAWSYPLFHASGVAGACGWLALLALVGGGPRESLGSVCAFLSAIGRRSMTAYLSQTLLFIVMFGVLGAFGVRVLGVAVSGLLALGVWALIGFGCVIAEVRGTSRGPAEWALRWLVAKTARPLPLPTLPLAFPAASVGPGVAILGPSLSKPPVPGAGPRGISQDSTGSANANRPI